MVVVHPHVRYFQEFHKAQSLALCYFCYNYVNDIAEGICSHIKLFANDCLIYRIIQSPSDQHTLQQDLNTFVNWAEKWQMKFNTAKCKIMQMTNCHNKLPFMYNV